MRRLAIILLALGISVQCRAFVTYGGSIAPAKATAKTITSGNFTISGSNLAISIEITWPSVNGTITVSSVAWSLGSGTPVQVNTDSNNAGTGSSSSAIWCIPAPASGTGTVQVNLSASASTWRFNADYWTNADQTTPCPTGDSVKNHTATNTYTLSPTNLTVNDASVGVGANGSSNISTVTQNQLLIDNTTNIDIGVGYSTATTSIGITMGDSNDQHSTIAARIQAPVAVSAPAAFRGLSINGGKFLITGGKLGVK